MRAALVSLALAALGLAMVAAGQASPEAFSSLKLSDRTLSWTHSGAVRTAQLQP